MKVLFYSSYHATPHIETELEIARGLIAGGHDIFFLHCKENLETCFANPEHTFAGCRVCISKIKRAYENLGISSKNILSFPSVKINFSDFYNVEQIKDITSLKQFTYKGWDIGLAVASSLVSVARDHQPDISHFNQFIEKGIRTAIYVYEAASKLLDELQPDVVYLFNGRFLEVRPFMRLCEARSIKFYTHERGGVLSRYLLREGSIPHSLESARKEIETLWGKGGKEKEEIGRKFFEERRNRVVQGWYSFTEKQISKLLPKNFDSQKMNIAIFNSSLDEFETIPGFTTPFYKDDNDGIEKLVAAFEHDETIHFYLRVHPNLKNQKNTQLKQIEEIGKKYKNITVINAEEEVDTYELMDKCDKIISFGSTTGIEAVYWNKPSILLGRAFYESLNCIYKPASHEKAIELINEPALSPFNQQEALKYGYWCLNMGIPFQHYTPTAVRKGNFDNKRITPHLFWRAFYIMENKLRNVKA
ncbi:MAG TPA: hypothetical protein VH396_07640 [Chitinophagaceae bacterium]